MKPEWPKVIFGIGDTSAIEYGGGAVLRFSDGSHQLEYTFGLEDDEDERPFESLPEWEQREREGEAGPWVTVYKVNIPRNVFLYYPWAEPEVMAHASDVDEPEDLYQAGESTQLADRAYAIQQIAAYYGWDELDSYPATYDLAELKARWSMNDKLRNPDFVSGLPAIFEIYGPLARSVYLLGISRSEPRNHFEVWDRIKSRHPEVEPWEVQTALEDFQHEGLVFESGQGKWLKQ